MLTPPKTGMEPKDCCTDDEIILNHKRPHCENNILSDSMTLFSMPDTVVPVVDSLHNLLGMTLYVTS